MSDAGDRVAEYRALIDLDEPVAVAGSDRWEEELRSVLPALGLSPSGSADEDLAALQAALAPLTATALDDATTARIEQIIVSARDADAVVDPASLPTIGELGFGAHGNGDKICLWVGDITNLAADGVVNAANSSLLGCRVPFHFCIDYALHGGAGPRMRRDCDRLIRAQGHPEPVGSAKLTRGYALPAPFVLHTVGPRLTPGTDPTPAEEADLRSCYRACLEAAAEVRAISTIAFCAISTGVFAYPAARAAAVALETVDEWLTARPDRLRRVVFNLFSEADADHYRRELGLVR